MPVEAREGGETKSTLDGEPAVKYRCLRHDDFFGYA